MKLFAFINLLLTINLNVIKSFEEINMPIYQYQEMKEIRYLYFYNLNNFYIDKIDIYIANKKLDYIYEYLGYYKIDLDNYYPIYSLNVKVNFDNPNFSLKITNKDDFNIEPFAYINVLNEKNIVIDNFIIENPEWGNIKFTYEEPILTKTIRIIN